MKNNLIWSVFKIFVSNIFSLGTFLEGFKKGIKSIIKNVFVIIMFLYLIVVAGGMYIFNMNLIGNGLAASGDLEKMPVLIIFTAFALVLFLGFISAATNYYTGCGEEQFLSMPLRSVEIFGAKVGVSALTDMEFGSLLIIIGGIIYGIKAGLLAKPLFYVGLLVTIPAVCSIALTFIYGLIILVLMLVPRLRNKSLLTGVATVLIFVFVISLSLLSSRISILLDMGSDTVTPIVQLLRLYVEKAPFLMFFANTLNGSLVSIFTMLAVSVLFVFVIIPLLAPVYIKTLNGFSEVKSKRISVKKARVVINRELKSNSIFGTLFVRDVRNVFREPSFFGNGPLMLIIIPAMIIISFAVSFTARNNTSFDELRNKLAMIFLEMTPESMESFKYYMVLVFSVISVFMGNCTNIAATSFSREGKALFDLKAMPIDPDTIALVKFCHAFMYCVVAVLILGVFMIAGIVMLGFPVTTSEAVMIFIEYAAISLIISLLLIFVEMFIDTINPKLLWENPMAAFKQNVNAIVSTFISMGVVFLSGLLMFFLPKNFMGLLLTAIIFGAIAAPVGVFYFRYAVKKIPKM